MSRSIFVAISIGWLLVLPYDGLWKHTYIDEHALQPAQVSEDPFYPASTNPSNSLLSRCELERVAAPGREWNRRLSRGGGGKVLMERSRWKANGAVEGEGPRCGR